jgi:hypothetical protein
MFRMTVVFLALALTVAHPGHAQTRESAPSAGESFRFFSDNRPIEVTTAVRGADLSLTFEFEERVKSYLNADDPFLSIELDFDTDNNVKTGQASMNDARRGCEFTLDVILRLPGSGKTEEVLLWRDVIDPKDGAVGKPVATNPRLTVEGKQMHLLIPLSALGLRKGQTIRIVTVSAQGNVKDQGAITLR